MKAISFGPNRYAGVGACLPKLNFALPSWRERTAWESASDLSSRGVRPSRRVVMLRQRCVRAVTVRFKRRRRRAARLGLDSTASSRHRSEWIRDPRRWLPGWQSYPLSCARANSAARRRTGANGLPPSGPILPSTAHLPSTAAATAAAQQDALSVILVTGGYDNTIRFWEAWSGVCSRTLNHQEHVSRACYGRAECRKQRLLGLRSSAGANQGHLDEAELSLTTTPPHSK